MITSSIFLFGALCWLVPRTTAPSTTRPSLLTHETNSACSARTGRLTSFATAFTAN